MRECVCESRARGDPPSPVCDVMCTALFRLFVTPTSSKTNVRETRGAQCQWRKTRPQKCKKKKMSDQLSHTSHQPSTVYRIAKTRVHGNSDQLCTRRRGPRSHLPPPSVPPPRARARESDLSLAIYGTDYILYRKQSYAQCVCLRYSIVSTVDCERGHFSNFKSLISAKRKT